MSDKISETKKVTTESEIGSNSVGHSMHSESGEGMASPEDLVKALEASQKTITLMSKEIATLKAKSADDSINKLADAIALAVNKKAPGNDTSGENLNTSKDFTQKNLIDGNSLMEAQASLMYYKKEEKIPVSIPKSFVDRIGPSLAISVNGVRVSIPCDGKTYYINKTHAIAAKERIAKIDRLLADTEPQIIETNA